MAKMDELNKQIDRMAEIVKNLDKYIDECTNNSFRIDAIDKKKVYLEVINSLKDYRKLKIQILEKGQATRNGEPPKDKAFEDYITTIEGRPQY